MLGAEKEDQCGWMIEADGRSKQELECVKYFKPTERTLNFKCSESFKCKTMGPD